MKKENSNKDFINDFITESYRSVQEKIEEIENSMNSFDLDDEEEQSVINWGGYEGEEEGVDVDEFAEEMFHPDNTAIEDIKSEFPEDFAQYGSLEDPKMITKLKKESIRKKIQKLIMESYLEEDIKNFTGDIPHVPGKDELRAVKNEIEDLNPNYTFKFDALKIRDKGLEISYDVEEGKYKVIDDSSGEEYYNKITYPNCSDCPFRSSEDVVEFIRKHGQERLEEEELGEERIANPKSKTHVNKLENFIGSHIYGEDLGGLGKMYVAYSYGEQFPVYVHYKGKWYHNTDSYLLDDGEVNPATEKHKKDMRPSKQTHGMSLRGLQSMIRAFKNKHNLGDNTHKDVEPGEKN